MPVPKFTFRLDSLLRLRCSHADERRAEPAQAFRAEEILREQREEIAGELAQTRQQRAAAGGTFDLGGGCEARFDQFGELALLRSGEQWHKADFVEVLTDRITHDKGSNHEVTTIVPNLNVCSSGIEDTSYLPTVTSGKRIPVLLVTFVTIVRPRPWAHL